MENDIGMQRLGAPAEHDGIAALDRDGRGVGRHGGSRFIDEENDPQRNTDLRDAQPIGPGTAVEDFSHRVGKGGDLPQPLRDGAEAIWGQPKAIQVGCAGR